MRRKLFVVVAMFLFVVSTVTPDANATGLLKKIFKKKAEPTKCEPPPCCASLIGSPSAGSYAVLASGSPSSGSFSPVPTHI